MLTTMANGFLASLSPQGQTQKTLFNVDGSIDINFLFLHQRHQKASHSMWHNRPSSSSLPRPPPIPLPSSHSKPDYSLESLLSSPPPDLQTATLAFSFTTHINHDHEHHLPILAQTPTKTSNASSATQHSLSRILQALQTMFQRRRRDELFVQFGHFGLYALCQWLL